MGKCQIVVKIRRNDNGWNKSWLKVGRTMTITFELLFKVLSSSFSIVREKW